MLISGWAVNENGVIGAMAGYLVGVPVGRLAAKKDFSKQQDEMTSNIVKLAKEREILKAEKYNAEDTYHAGNAYMQQAEIITREANKHVATASKQIEKIKQELKGAHARAYRKIKRLERK